MSDRDLSAMRGTAWQYCMLCSWGGALTEKHECPRTPEKLEETIRGAEEQLCTGWPEEARKTLRRAIDAIDSIKERP